MKISLFLLITTLICLYFGQATSSNTAMQLHTNTEKTQPISTKDSEQNTILPTEENNTQPADSILENSERSEEETEEYLNFVRKQMKESIREHLLNIQRELGEEYEEQAEKLILL